MSTPTHILIKLLKVKVKDRIMKREKKVTSHKEWHPERLSADFSAKNLADQKREMVYLKY